MMENKCVSSIILLSTLFFDKCYIVFLLTLKVNIQWHYPPQFNSATQNCTKLFFNYIIFVFERLSKFSMLYKLVFVIFPFFLLKKKIKS